MNYQKPLPKLIWVITLHLIAFPAFADEECDEFLKFENSFNANAPTMVDEFTEAIQVKVNCEARSVTFVKRLLVDEKDLFTGWKDRKQRQHTQLHCNQDGLAFKFGWAVRDTISDVNFNYLVTLITTPADCRQ